MLAARFPANKHLIHKHPGDPSFLKEISVNDTEIPPGRGIGLGPGVYEYRNPPGDYTDFQPEDLWMAFHMVMLTFSS